MSFIRTNKGLYEIFCSINQDKNKYRLFDIIFAIILGSNPCKGCISSQLWVIQLLRYFLRLGWSLSICTGGFFHSRGGLKWSQSGQRDTHKAATADDQKG